MSKGYTNNPIGLGIPVHGWDSTRKGRAMLAEADRVNRPGRDGWAEADFIAGNDRPAFVPVNPDTLEEWGP